MGKNKGRSLMPGPALENFCSTKGIELPSDWTDHLPGGYYEDECVFCKAQTYGTYWLAIDKNRFAHHCSLPVGICEACMTHCINELGTSWALAQDELCVGASVDWAETIESYIIPYISRGVIPNSNLNSSYYVPSDLRQTDELYCDFCRNDVMEVGQFYPENTKNSSFCVYIYKPISDKISTVEPPAICCNRCDAAIDELYPRIDVHQSYKESQESQLIMISCANCKATHPVTISEQGTREMSAHVFDMEGYVCSLCAEEHWGNRRFVQYECDDCGTQFTLDLLHKSAYQKDLNNICKCKNKAVRTIKLPPINGKEFTITLMPIDCGSRKRTHITVKDNSITKGDNIILHIGSQKAKYCTGKDGDECGCTTTDQIDIDNKLREIVFRLCEYVTNTDANNSS